jgi:hypothetical protein
VATTVVVAADTDYQRTDFRGAAEAVGAAHGPRALVVLALAGEITIEQYLPDAKRMSPSGAAVSEIVIAAPRAPKLGGPDVGRPRVPPVLPAPFRLVERRYAQTFTMVRYRAPRPVVVRPAILERAALPIVGAPTVLLQR